MSSVLIWGAAGQARVVADILRLTGRHEIVGFIDDVSPERWGESFLDSTILGGQEQLDKLRRQGVGKAIVAVGDCADRLRPLRNSREPGPRVGSGRFAQGL